MAKYIMALDQGTTSSRAIIFDRNQHIVAVAQREFTQYFPQAGYVEHDPMEIYASQVGVMNEVLALSDISPGEIGAIGITNQRETTILWDRTTGQPVYNAIVWQCRRTADICEKLKSDGHAEYIRENTGLIIDAYFSATKIKWILDNVPGVRERAQKGDILFGTVDTWLIWKLTGGAVHVTDYTNASRTMIYNIRDKVWDDNLLQIFGIPKSILPEVRSSSEIYGMANISGVNIPIAGVAGDQQAALFGHACFKSGEVKNTYGTGCFLLMNTGTKLYRSSNGLVSTIAAGIGSEITYALEGSIFVAGAAIQWLRDEMHFFLDSAESESIASETPDTGGVFFVPAFTGLGAPHWDMYARGAIVGLTRGTNRSHIIRAALEAIAYETKDVINAMEADTGIAITELKADGGASANNFLMQFQADIINTPVSRPVIKETTALGAACLAGLAIGFWKDISEIKNHTKCEMRYTPSMAEARRTMLYAGWNRALGRSKNWLSHMR